MIVSRKKKKKKKQTILLNAHWTEYASSLITEVFQRRQYGMGRLKFHLEIARDWLVLLYDYNLIGWEDSPIKKVFFD